MTISLKHTFTSAKSDGADATLVQPSNWNAEHTLTAAAGKVLGRDTSGAGVVQELPIAVDSSGNVSIAGNFATDGNATFGNASGDTVTLNAATVSIPNNVNFSGGNVGIGTSSPGTRLDVSDVSKYTFSVSNAYTLLTSLNAAGSAFADAYTNALSHIWQTSGTERMRITSAGNVGIGTANPNAKLDVVVGADQRLLFTERGTGGAVIDAVNAANSAYKLMVLNASQLDVQISASTKFSLAATSGTITSQPTYDNTAAGSTVVVTSTGLIRRTSSSIKYKKDVESLDPTLATNAINNLRPVWYRTKNPEGDDKATWSHIGLIAEEVDKVEPRLVRYRTAEVIQNEDGTTTTQELAVPEPEDVDYARLAVLLLQEVQTLRQRVAALEAK